MASMQSGEQEVGGARGAARSEKRDSEADSDASLVDAAEAFLAAQRQCSRTNVEASLGTSLAVSPGLLGYDAARVAREDALSRLRSLQARGLGGLAAKRVVLLTLVDLLGSDDPRIFEFANEVIEEYHTVLVAVWPGEKLPEMSSHAGWINTSSASLPQLVGATEDSRTAR